MWHLRLSPRQAQGRDWEQAALQHLKHQNHEVLLFHALDRSSLDCLDECGPVVGVNNGLADTENHRFETPFAVSRVTRGGPGFLP